MEMGFLFAILVVSKSRRCLWPAMVAISPFARLVLIMRISRDENYACGVVLHMMVYLSNFNFLNQVYFFLLNLCISLSGYLIFFSLHFLLYEFIIVSVSVSCD